MTFSKKMPLFFNAHVKTYSKWGSDQANNRLKIRKGISQFLEQSKIPFNKPLLLDLSKIPRIESCCISISHTKNIGGYLISLDGSYGFDLENKQITNKVCVKIDAFDDSKFFIENKLENLYWSAKEASLKAIFNKLDQKILISKIYIEQLFFGSDFLGYRFSSTLDPTIFGVGVAKTRLGYTFSIAKLKKP